MELSRTAPTHSGRRSSRITKFRTTPPMRRGLAYKAMLARGWTEDEEDWDIFWADVYSVGLDSGFKVSQLQEHQKLNHFPRHVELTRKDHLVKNLKRTRKSLLREGKDTSQYDFFPQTFTLPQEYGMFANEARKDPGTCWIMKPCGRSQGNGIFLVNRISQVYHWRKEQAGKEQPEAYVVSRYIERPLLVGGRKFDLRIYVLVMSFSPLQVYLYRAGFCRFTTGRYSADRGDLDNLGVHLTNVAVQKRKPGYDPVTGMKWALSSLRKYLAATYGQPSTCKLFKAIQDVVVHSLLAVQHVITHDRHCFELFGYDVLIDEDLKPWLIEVNASPSLSADTAADQRLKFEMLDDTLALVEADVPTCTHLPETLGGFDLIWSGSSPVAPHPTLQSLLGCFVPRRRKHARR